MTCSTSNYLYGTPIDPCNICMYVCMYVVCMYCVRMYLFICLFIYLCMYACMYLCMYVYMYVFMCICKYVKFQVTPLRFVRKSTKMLFQFL
jgi:hypothetical protein